MTAQTYLHRSGRALSRWAARGKESPLIRGALWALAGFLSGAASLYNFPQPVAMGLISALRGWQAAAAAAGSILGFRIFWGQAGFQPVIWSLCALILALIPGKWKDQQKFSPLPAAVGAFAVSVTGLIFQALGAEEIPFAAYLTRVALAGGCIFVGGKVLIRQDPVYRWLAEAAVLLALAQVAPLPWLNLGFFAAGMLSVAEALPGVAMGALALDLAGVSPVPVTAAMCLAFLLRRIPLRLRWLRFAFPAGAFIAMMVLSGRLDLLPLPVLLAGGAVGLFLPGQQETALPRGETGMAQVRLEVMAGVLNQIQQLLLETREPEVDTAALLARTRERACGSCPNRKLCRDVALPEDSLERSYPELGSLSIPCKKPGRMIQELRRSKEQLRLLRAHSRERNQYRQALVQQYGFLSEYLRRQADELPRRAERLRQRYRVDVGVCTAGKETVNGDTCQYFSGTRCRYYILLCDGMGTGLGAAEEGGTAAAMIRQMLTAGYPAEFALRSVNSLCCLRGLAGAVSLDLAEICLDSGKVTLYKWGAAPSFLLRRAGAEKIGTAAPPPGLSVEDARETVERLSLRRGEALILTSDGVDGEGVLRRMRIDPGEPPGEVAALLLEHGADQIGDDATAAVIRLHPTTLRI